MHYQSYAEARPIWTDNMDARDAVGDGRVFVSNQATIWRWREAFQNNFAARLDWNVRTFDEANHNPNVVLNGRPGTSVLNMRVASGTELELSAAGTTDSDGNALSYHWWIYPEAGTYPGHVEINNSGGDAAWVEIPDDAPGRTIHVMFEVADSRSPSLRSFRRAILNVETR